MLNPPKGEYTFLRQALMYLARRVFWNALITYTSYKHQTPGLQGLLTVERCSSSSDCCLFKYLCMRVWCMLFRWDTTRQSNSVLKEHEVLLH